MRLLARIKSSLTAAGRRRTRPKHLASIVDGMDGSRECGGRTELSKTGRVRTRVQSGQSTINIGKEANVSPPFDDQDGGAKVVLKCQWFQRTSEGGSDGPRGRTHNFAILYCK